MKVIFILLLAISVALVGFSQPLVIKGKINISDTVKIVLTDGIRTDTVLTASGYFRFDRQAEGLLFSLSVFNKSGGLEVRKEFFARSGEVSLDPSFNLTLSDPELQEKYEGFKTQYDLLMRLKNDVVRYHLHSKNLEDEKLLFDSVYNAVIGFTVNMIGHFVTENKDNLLGPYVCAGYLLQGIDTGRLEKIYSSLNKDLFDSSYALQMIKKRVDVIQGLLPGKPAPDFSAVSHSGKNVSSAGLKGKYAVLDYWASWCGPCMMGLPRMKRYYEKYKGKVEFVSISCRDTKQAWLEAIKKYALPWPQILNPTTRDGLEKIYGVARFPTKIIVDPDGNLVGIFTGELEDFYVELDKLLNIDKTASAR